VRSPHGDTRALRNTLTESGSPVVGYKWIDEPDDDDGDDGQGQQQPPPGQQQLPAPARQHMRKVERERDTLKAELEALRAEKRKVGVADVVKAKGYDPMIAELIPAGVDGDDAIGKWLDERTAVFAKTKVDADDNGSDAGQVPPDVAAALGTVSNLTAAAISPAKPADLLAQLNDPTLTPERLNALLRANGAKI